MHEIFIKYILILGRRRGLVLLENKTKFKDGYRLFKTDINLLIKKNHQFVPFCSSLKKIEIYADFLKLQYK